MKKGDRVFLTNTSSRSLCETRHCLGWNKVVASAPLPHVGSTLKKTAEQGEWGLYGIVENDDDRMLPLAPPAMPETMTEAFHQMFCCGPIETSENERWLRVLAYNYYVRCELYDQMVCHHRDVRGIALPQSVGERQAVNRNAKAVHEECVELAKRRGFTAEQFCDARRAILRDFHWPCHCHAASDGECHWRYCPQLLEPDPKKPVRSCPLPIPEEE